MIKIPAFFAAALLAVAPAVLPPCNGEPTPPPVPTPAPVECVVTGCSGQVCAAQDTPTTCEWTCEYGCYQYADCEVQPQGVCGWTGNDEFEACIDACAGSDF